MKAILKFDLDNKEDDLAHKRCVKALDMAMMIWKFALNSRKEIESKVNSDESYAAIDLVYKRFWELCEEYVIDPDALID